MSDRLPPRRTLPDDVRDRLRAEVRAGIGKPRRAKHVWYAAAAAVVVLAAGAVVATHAIRRPADTGPAPAASGALTLDAQVAKSSLDRCWAALQAAGKSADRAGSMPPRAEWVPLFTQVQGADAVVAATAGGEPLFCETTETTVTLSDPTYIPTTVPGVNFALMLHTATGVVAGTLGPGAEGALLESRTEGGEPASQVIRFSPVTRQFVVMTGTDPARTTLTLDNSPDPKKYVLPEAPPPLVSVVDRPVTADRTSPAGRALGECLPAAAEVIPDAAAYAPGPLLETDGYRVVLGRFGEQVVVCTTEPDPQRPGKRKSRAYPDFTGPRLPVRALKVNTLGGGVSRRTPFIMALPLNAAKATIGFRGGTSVEADVVGGMALTWIPEHTDVHPGATAHVVARDARGTIVYDGSLPLG